ncbi:MAG: hypothetical protein IPI67_34835 [Myxococcales bacterium]|nr:hypothetical protein [Myxococcales bacterium]
MLRRALWVACLFSVAPLAGCSSDDAGGSKQGTGGSGGTGGNGPVDALLEATCTDSIDDVYATPPALTGDAGALLRCAHDKYLTKDELLAQAKARGYDGPDFVSGAHVYRVLFLTSRGDATNSPGFSTGVVYLPDAPIADKAPLVASGHGTVGQGKDCLVSKNATLAGGDPPAQWEPIAGAGYPVIAPDYAGYSQFGAAGNPVSGYLLPNDAPRSLLDSVHTLRSMIPSHAAQEVVLTGHSQGGHVALSALAMAESHGIDGKLSGVVVYAPFWMSGLMLGVGLFIGGGIPIQGNELLAGAGAWYYYSAAELADGPGHGADMFAPAKQDTVKTFVSDACLGDNTLLHSLGEFLADPFDPEFVKGVGGSAMSGAPCATDGSEAAKLCEKWLPRLKSSRPHLTGSAKSVPILWMYGDKDTSVSPGFATCGVDRLNADGAALETCMMPGKTHGGIVRSGSGRVNQWIGATTLGLPAPPPCDLDFTFTTDGTGAKLSSMSDGKGGQTVCQQPPNNLAD